MSNYIKQYECVHEAIEESTNQEQLDKSYEMILNFREINFDHKDIAEDYNALINMFNAKKDYLYGLR